jgi:hypothetical protein
MLRSPIWVRPIVKALALAVMAISTTTMLGHYLSIPVLRDWGLVPAMAFNTAVCFWCVAAAVFLLSREE